MSREGTFRLRGRDLDQEARTLLRDAGVAAFPRRDFEAAVCVLRAQLEAVHAQQIELAFAREERQRAENQLAAERARTAELAREVDLLRVQLREEQRR